MKAEFERRQIEAEIIPGVLTIGWDFDAIFTNLTRSVQTFIGDPLGIDTIHSPSQRIYDFSKWPVVMKKHEEEYVRQCFVNPLFYREADPIWPMIHLAQKLHEDGHNQSVITARSKEHLQGVTYEQLEAFGLEWMIPSTHFVDYELNLRGIQKQLIATKLDLNIYIDDHGPTILGMMAPTLIAKIIVDFPWNRQKNKQGEYKFDDPYTYRVNHAREVAWVVERVSKAHFLHYSIPV